MITSVVPQEITTIGAYCFRILIRFCAERNVSLNSAPMQISKTEPSTTPYCFARADILFFFITIIFLHLPLGP